MTQGHGTPYLGEPEPRTRSHGEFLRVVGRLLDEEERQVSPVGSSLEGADGREVRQLKITEDFEAIALTWETRGGLPSRSVTHDELRQLGDLAQYLRRRPNQPASGSGRWEETLRTLGQVVDSEEIALRGIFENAGRFHVSGRAGDGSLFSFRYTEEELRGISVLRSLLRNAAVEVGSAPPVWRRDGWVLAA